MIRKILLRILLAIALVIVVLAGNLAIFNILASKVSEGIPIADPPPPNSALLVIDIQGGTTGEVSALKGLREQSEQLIQEVNSLIEEAQASGRLIVYVRTEVVNPLLNILNNTMARGSAGAELDPRLLMNTGEVVVKRRKDPFIGTQLDQILEEHQIGELVLVGLDAGQCVMGAARAARNRGYAIKVVEEAVITNEVEDKAEALEDLRALGVDIISMD
jgi:nicotinamidase-related amidase